VCRTMERSHLLRTSELLFSRTTDERWMLSAPATRPTRHPGRQAAHPCVTPGRCCRLPSQHPEQEFRRMQDDGALPPPAYVRAPVLANDREAMDAVAPATRIYPSPRPPGRSSVRDTWSLLSSALPASRTGALTCAGRWSAPTSCVRQNSCSRERPRSDGCCRPRSAAPGQTGSPASTRTDPPSPREPGHIIELMTLMVPSSVSRSRISRRARR
jgi:hypothetical protein